MSNLRCIIEEVADGRIRLHPTLPVGVPIKGPLKFIEVSSPGMIPMPLKPMTLDEFKESLPAGSKVKIGMLA